MNICITLPRPIITAILSGHKKTEYRRNFCPNLEKINPDTVIYVCEKGTRRIPVRFRSTGAWSWDEAGPDEAIRSAYAEAFEAQLSHPGMTPDAAFERVIGLSIDKFRRYCLGADFVTEIPIRRPNACELTLDELGLSRAPQQFSYVRVEPCS